MAINVSNTTLSLASALKDIKRFGSPYTARKEIDTPDQAAAKAITVSISTDAKIQVLKIT